jgi:Tol biopolymer transport system component
VAVVLHIDDSMAWGRRKELVSNSANIETADWRQIPNTGRRLDWGKTPTKFPPQMCFNAPAIIAAVKARGALIGEETKRQMDTLKAAGKEHLFGGILAGWETRIGRDFDTDQPLGFRALSNRGFSEKNPPKDDVQERAQVVKEFMELWANALHAPGVPREKIYCHLAFTAQGLDHKEKTQTVSTFALPEVAFSRAYRPGFSTYPEGAALQEIQGHVAAHDSPPWVSAEATNVSPSGMASGLTMETFLGRHFNHGAVMVNLFAWQMGGEAMKNHFFRRAIEGPESLAAFGKFLRGEKLVESAATGFSSEALEAKMQRIQKQLPAWIQKTGKQEQAMSLVKNMQVLIKEKRWQDADKVADEILSLISARTSGSARNGLIALALRDQNGKLQIFTITSDGTNRKQLTIEGDNGRPDWSPDGCRITFNAKRDGEVWVAVMDADGANQKMLTVGAAPDWAPDGRQIAFSRPDDRQIAQIWIMNADGSNIRQITQSNTAKIGPSWSPDGKQMVFIQPRNPLSEADPQPEIGIMNSDGTKERILTTADRVNVRVNPDGSTTVCEAANDANAPAWSPVDNRITFWSGIENQYGQIWVINSDGTGSKQLTEDCSHRNSDDPSWSPDGKEILFSTARSGKPELWVMDADGNNEKRVSDIDAVPFPGRASWQPIPK